MKRIALLVFGMLVLVSGTVEARPFLRRNRTSTQPAHVTYTQPVRVAPAASTTCPTCPTCPAVGASYARGLRHVPGSVGGSHSRGLRYVPGAVGGSHSRG